MSKFVFSYSMYLMMKLADKGLTFTVNETAVLFNTSGISGGTGAAGGKVGGGGIIVGVVNMRVKWSVRMVRMS